VPVAYVAAALADIAEGAPVNGTVDLVGLERFRRYLNATDDPVECGAFWRELADLGVIEERLMNRMGASP
jgi:hypothetical protein